MIPGAGEIGGGKIAKGIVELGGKVVKMAEKYLGAGKTLEKNLNLVEKAVTKVEKPIVAAERKIKNGDLTDGGTNNVDNIEPLSHDEHMQIHIDNGDFIRWGKLGGKK